MAAKKSESVPAIKHAQRGKYVYKPIVSIIVLCSCGNKYVKTRNRQLNCVRCINEK